MINKKYLTFCTLVIIMGVLAGYKSVGPVVNFITSKGGGGSDIAIINGSWKTYKGLGTANLQPIVKAVVAQIGLGALTAEEAMYWIADKDSNGARLDGKTSYIVTLAPEQLHQNGGFWGLSLYGPDNYFAPNTANINSLGLRDNLQKNPDGSMDIFVSQANDTAYNNWLPAPIEGKFNLTLRYYIPTEDMISDPTKIRMPVILATSKSGGDKGALEP